MSTGVAISADSVATRDAVSPLPVVQRLDWDSHFFGFGVGRCNAPFGNAATLSEALGRSAHEGLRLIYGMSPGDDAESASTAKECQGLLVDDKLTFEIALQPTSELTLPPDAGSDACSRRQLRVLAWQSAEYSRFRIDPAMPHGAWRKLYSAWIYNSLNGQIADAVMVVPDSNGRLLGMVSVAHRQQYGQIGLLAVHPESRGRGLGRRLVMAAMARSASAGCTHLQVVTQGANDTACALYRACGMHIAAHQRIHHFWSNKP